LNFAAGSGTAIDLAATLPSHVRKGGTFGVSSSGAALPVGMTLSPTGMLAVGSAAVRQTAGVVFTYAEP
jgi:hypothetical protein